MKRNYSFNPYEFKDNRSLTRVLGGSMVNNGNRQRVVSLGDVEMFLGCGWSFVAKLNDE